MIYERTDTFVYAFSDTFLGDHSFKQLCWLADRAPSSSESRGSNPRSAAVSVANMIAGGEEAVEDAEGGSVDVADVGVE